jgi:hypothetical protein
MSRRKRLAWPLMAALAGSGGLTLLYFGIVSLAESPEHALTLFWEDRWIVLPIILGFGVQAALYVILKKQLFVPVANTGPSTALTGASGGASTVAMAACCAHHVSDVLPILGFTAAATFLAEYRIPFMLVGLGMMFAGIVVMLITLWRERHKAMQRPVLSTEAA